MSKIVLDTWHPVNGEWVHIVQTETGSTRTYYTDGKHTATEHVLAIDYFLKPARKPYQDTLKPTKIDQIDNNRSA